MNKEYFICKTKVDQPIVQKSYKKNN